MTFSLNSLAEKKKTINILQSNLSQFQFLDQTFDCQEIWYKHTTEDSRPQPKNALNEVQFKRSIKVLHVPAPGCHSQGV